MSRPVNTAQVVTNLRCNQRCGYCDRRSPTDDLAAISWSSLTARIDAAVAGGASDVRLSGGEPTLRGDLVRLVAYAKQAGAERVSLETNATLLDRDRAQQLAAAGLTLARVNLVGTDERVDVITADPGGFARTVAGLDALVAAGVAVELLCALTRSTSELVLALPSWASERLGPSLRALEVAVPTSGPDRNELLSYEDAALVLVALDAACRQVAVSLRASPGDAPPPCILPARARLGHLYSLSPEIGQRSGFQKQPVCKSCLLDDRCSGLSTAYLGHHAPPPMTPITEDRMRRRLSLSGTVDEQITRELSSRHLVGLPDGTSHFEEIIRVNFHCNQACEFCFVSTHLPTARDEAIESAIRAAGQRGSRIGLSGGEPTLHKRLPEWIRLAVVVSKHPVYLQTNAIRLDDPELVAALVAAGLCEAFVSLHGATAEVSDQITSAPGTFVRTVVGLDHLHQTRILVSLNFVICEANRHQLVDTIRLVAARWPKASLNVSFVGASTDLVPRTKDLIPSYSSILPELTLAVAEAKRLGVELRGFESMCGIPLCLLPSTISLSSLNLPEIPANFDQGEFVRGAACKSCSHNTRCYGLRRQYANLHGTNELTAL